MKITTFNPMIITKDAEAVIKVFEALGFERRHTKENINDADITSVRMTDPNGFHIDVAEAHVDKDISTIRMNVDDFDEAYNFLTERGFKNSQGERTTETGSSKATLMVSPSGFSINLVEHIKK
jgi:hypothetical protein